MAGGRSDSQAQGGNQEEGDHESSGGDPVPECLSPDERFVGALAGCDPLAQPEAYGHKDGRENDGDRRIKKRKGDARASGNTSRDAGGELHQGEKTRGDKSGTGAERGLSVSFAETISR